eukprot:GFUD01008028.1.p1 GENE.GFUD01008028.1~~GFUD01008028.1.p1  ORF type:complete len:495 (+),score=242.56 GFUD01008028.1:91-1575(+)
MMDNFDNRPQVYGEVGIQSTAGAIPVKNDKGEISMQKVKVQRYISGKRPDYASRMSSSEEESEGEDFISKARGEKDRERGRNRDRHYQKDSDSSRSPSPAKMQEDRSQGGVEDPRLKRLLEARLRDREDQGEDEDEEERRERLRRRRRVQEPEVVEEMEIEQMDTKKDIIKPESDDEDSDDSDSSDEEMDEEAIIRRRELMRQRALAKAQLGVKQEEVLEKEEERSGPEDEEEGETTEEETDSEEEEQGARLKPVFVRAKDRLTIQEREREELKARQAEREAARAAEERRRQTLRMVEDEVRKSTMADRKEDGDTLGMDEVNTDDENDEVEYETWKVRELKRLKRDRDEREDVTKEQQELERMRNMTEEERRAELKANPKIVTNKASKGKYKFMQKYYHRGAFYTHEEDELLKRDYSGATLEDKFDKTVLPKVMQVKNFGRSGRTKYTHLVDQDTTQFDAAWSQESATNQKFLQAHAGGMKQQFNKPGRIKERK